MIARRMLMLIALLMGLAALAVSIAPPPPRTTTNATPAPPAAGTPPDRGVTTASPGEATIRDIAADRRDQVIRVREGERIRLRVSALAPVAVQLGDDGPIEAVDADAPAEFEILVDRPLDEPIRLLDGPEIGRLVTAAG